MPRKFRNKIRLRVAGVMNEATGVMAGGVVVGHFAASHTLASDRPVLTSRVANGPTVQDVDPDDDTGTITVELQQDAVAARNLQTYAADGGYVEVIASDAIDQKAIARYAPFKFGGFGATGPKDAATETVTLVGTNLLREAEWIADQNDLPSGGGGGGGGA